MRMHPNKRLTRDKDGRAHATSVATTERCDHVGPAANKAIAGAVRAGGVSAHSLPGNRSLKKIIKLPIMCCHPGKPALLDSIRGGVRMEPSDFRKFAEECLRLADQVQSVEDKSALLSMAEAWIRIADQGEEVCRLIGEIAPQSSQVRLAHEPDCPDAP